MKIVLVNKSLRIVWCENTINDWNVQRAQQDISRSGSKSSPIVLADEAYQISSSAVGTFVRMSVFVFVRQWSVSFNLDGMFVSL